MSFIYLNWENKKINLPYISVDELTKTRSPAELCEWVQNKFDEIAEIPGGKDAIRFRKGLCKQFVEEVYPLSIYGMHKYAINSTARLTPVLGNQSYDALVEDSSAKVQYKLEITQAHEGQDEYLRMLALKRDGHVWPFGKISKSGTKEYWY